MFTGLVEEVGVIESSVEEGSGRRFVVRAPGVASDLEIGSSVSVNGVCQTVVAKNGSSFTLVAVPETLRRTNLGGLAAGGRVNLERPLRLSDRLGGHLVQGHVDGIGRVRAMAPEPPGWRIEIEAPTSLLRYVAEKGSIAVDGVSLTVAELLPDGFRVALIPHTWEETICREYEPGRGVNLEVDFLARYLERLTSAG